MHRIPLIVLHVAALAYFTVAPAMAQQVSTVLKKYTIVIDDDLVVRRLHPLPLFDDRGRPRKPTAKELKDMKGPNPKLKGYQAELGQLKPGQLVVITLARTKASASKAKSNHANSSAQDSTMPKKIPYAIIGEYTGRLVRPPLSQVKDKGPKRDSDATHRIVVGLPALLLPGQRAPAPRDKVRLPPTMLVVRVMIVGEPADR